jgi:hypothetical protein
MSIFEYLNLRSYYEVLTLNMKIPGARKPGTLSNMKWFIRYGYDINKKFSERDEVWKIATKVVSEM